MKKLFLVLALVAAYGVSMAMPAAEINTVKCRTGNNCSRCGRRYQ